MLNFPKPIVRRYLEDDIRSMERPNFKNKDVIYFQYLKIISITINPLL